MGKSILLLLLHQLLLISECVRSQQTGGSSGVERCVGRTEDPLCIVTGQLNTDCPTGATSLALRFNGAAASWPAEGGGLTSCSSVGQLKVTGWSGPDLTAAHLNQLPVVTSVTIVDGALQTVGADVSSNNLQDLVLARNHISSVHQLSLTRCHSLRSLDLSDNRIDHLPDRWLVACRSLRSLRLNGNRLTGLSSNVLLGAIDLTELQMQKNQLQVLNSVELSFINNHRLALIDLRNNGLFSYLPSDHRGFCGPSNATVLMHIAGCPPGQDSCPALKHECIGKSAHLAVTFTSCQAVIRSRCPPAAPTSPVATCPAAQPPAGAAADTPSPTSTDGRLLSQLGVAPEGAWLLYALVGTAAFTLLQLAVFLAVCHRLKLRIARLQARAEGAAASAVAEFPSLGYFRQPTMCSHSQSALSERLTPSGRGPSSHCGFSNCGDAEPPMLPPPLVQQQQPLPPVGVLDEEEAEEQRPLKQPLAQDHQQ